MYSTRTERRGRRGGASRAILGLVLTSALAFVLVGTAAVVIARRIAEHTALAEAERATQAFALTDVEPYLAQLMAGDPAAVESFDQTVATRRADSGLLRVKVWTRDGRVLFSDNPAAIGHTFPLDEAVVASIDHGTSSSDLSMLSDPENKTEADLLGQRVVEVYTALAGPRGERLAFETYSTDAPVSRAEHALVDSLVPFALGSLVLLVLLQLPTSIWMVRRVARAADEQGRLMRGLLAASDRERRAIAQDLHDGMAQQLAAAGYLMEFVRSDLPDTTAANTRDAADRVATVIADATMSLRTSLADIYPADLRPEGLPDALDDLAEPLRERGVEVTVTGGVPADLPQDTAVWLYRFGRECLQNIEKHARTATHVGLALSSTGGQVSLTASDDGAGVKPKGAPRAGEKLGLRFLRDAASDLGGSMTITSRQGGGTRVCVSLPAHRGQSFPRRVIPAGGRNLRPIGIRSRT